MIRLLSVALVLLLGSALRGEPPPGVKTIRLELEPTPSRAPVLRYPLLPELRDQKPGNAVPLYRKAAQTLKTAQKELGDPRWYERAQRWIEIPPDRLPRAEVQDFLDHHRGALAEVEDAARHEYADWELTEKIRNQGVGTLLPDVQEMREFANLLSLRARLAMAEGRHHDALRDIQTIFAISRDVAHAPCLICSLVGVATGMVGANQLDQLIQQPGAPNLYWVLTDLPAPFIDMRMSLQGERLMAYGTFGGLPLSRQDANKKMTPMEIENAVRMAEGLRRDIVNLPRPVFKAQFGLDVQQKHDKAKRALVEAGWPRDAVEQMPHVQVALLHGFIDYERFMDEEMKWATFPFWQAAPHLLELEKERLK